MQRSKSLALMFLLGALLVGGALGFTADRLIGGGMRQPPKDRVSWREVLATDLNLSPEQRAAFDSILEKRHEDMSTVFATIRPQLDSIRLGARTQMMSRLDADQRQRFQQFIDRKNEEKKNEERRTQGSSSR